MSAIKGHPSQKRINHGASNEAFASVLNTDPKNRAGLDVLPKAIYPVDLLAKTAEALDLSIPLENKELKVIKLTGADATIRKADLIRFTTGTNKGMEIPVEKADGDYIYLAGELLGDPSGDEFLHMRFITLTIDETGALSVSNGPIQFVKDGVANQVIKDTITSANTVGLPVEIVGSDGATINITAGDIGVQLDHAAANPDSTRIGDGTNLMGVNSDLEALVHDQDTHDKLGAINAKFGSLGQKLKAGSAPVVLASEQETLINDLKTLLTSLDGKDYATQSTLAALNTKAATETTLAAIRAAVETLDNIVNGSSQAEVRLADLNGAATAAKQDTIITELGKIVPSKPKVIDLLSAASATILSASRYSTGVTVPVGMNASEIEILVKTGANFTAYDAATGGNAIGVFTQAGGRLPCDLPAGTSIFLQSNTGSDLAVEDLTINLIGA